MIQNQEAEGIKLSERVFVVSKDCSVIDCPGSFSDSSGKKGGQKRVEGKSVVNARESWNEARRGKIGKTVIEGVFEETKRGKMRGISGMSHLLWTLRLELKALSHERAESITEEIDCQLTSHVILIDLEYLGKGSFHCLFVGTNLRGLFVCRVNDTSPSRTHTDNVGSKIKRASNELEVREESQMT